MSATDVLEKTLARLLHWIAAADTKMSWLLAIHTAMLGVLVALTPKPLVWGLGSVSSVIAGLILLVSVLMLTAVAFPRTDGPKESLIYFGGIVSYEYETYRANISGLNPEDYCDQLTQQCYRNAEIANAKFKWLQGSMITLFIAIIPWLVALACAFCEVIESESGT